MGNDIGRCYENRTGGSAVPTGLGSDFWWLIPRTEVLGYFMPSMAGRLKCGRPDTSGPLDSRGRLSLHGRGKSKSPPYEKRPSTPLRAGSGWGTPLCPGFSAVPTGLGSNSWWLIPRTEVLGYFMPSLAGRAAVELRSTEQPRAVRPMTPTSVVLGMPTGVLTRAGKSKPHPPAKSAGRMGHPLCLHDQRTPPLRDPDRGGNHGLESSYAAQDLLDVVHSSRPARRLSASLVVGRRRDPADHVPVVVDRVSQRLVLKTRTTANN